MSLKRFRQVGIAGILFLAMIILMNPVKTQAADAMWTARYWNNPTLSGDPVLERNEAEINYDWGDGSPVQGVVNNENFSVYWKRSINFSTGTYRFTATMDDGMRVWVDGTLIIDSWWDSQVHSMSHDRYLNAGDHTVEVRYYDVGAKAVAKLSWTAVGGSAPGPITNWRGEYFNNTNLSGTPVLVRDDAQINFDWGAGSPAWNVVASDQFSARWTRNVSFQPGRYRFTVIADDGVRLWVNGQPLVDKWLDSLEGTYIVDVDLSGGSVPVKMEYYENIGGAVARLDWIQLSGSGSANWRGEYFNNKSLSGSPALVRDDGTINFNWSGSPAPTLVIADNFSVRWSRNLSLTSGRYRFTAAVDDGVRLWVNNSLIIDQWKDQSLTTYTAEIELPAGSIPVRMEYYDATGTAEAHLSWTQLTTPPTSGNGSGQGGVGTATVASTLLNVRQGPGVSYPIITTLSRGAVVQLGGYRNATTTWVMVILPSGQQGWSYAPYLQTSYNLASLPVWTPPNSGGTPSGATATVVVAYHLNVRSGPGVSFTPIMTIPRGTVVELVGRNSSSTWLKIRMPSGTQGWSNAYYLQTTYTISSLPVLTN